MKAQNMSKEQQNPHMNKQILKRTKQLTCIHYYI